MIQNFSTQSALLAHEIFSDYFETLCIELLWKIAERKKNRKDKDGVQWTQQLSERSLLLIF